MGATLAAPYTALISTRFASGCFLILGHTDASSIAAVVWLISYTTSLPSYGSRGCKIIGGFTITGGLKRWVCNLS